MKFVIDIGNTSTKYTVFSSKLIIHQQKAEHSRGKELQYIQLILKKFPEINSAIISSVKKENCHIIRLLNKKCKHVIQLNHTTPIPIKNLYETKKTLGYDRIAGACGANNIFPDSNVLIIDSGTAITFDLVNNKNEYIGGNISPGINMRFKALNKFTDNLPLYTTDINYEIIGKNTREAIISGVQNGVLFEVESYIKKLSDKIKDIKVILTGGDTFFFDNKLKKPIFAEPNLVAIGLRKILEYNILIYEI